MKKIYKQFLENKEEQVIQLKAGDRFLLKFGVQDGAICFWYLHDDQAALVNVTIYIKPTGWNFDVTEESLIDYYVDTIQLSDKIVFHIFMKVEQIKS